MLPSAPTGLRSWVRAAKSRPCHDGARTRELMGDGPRRHGRCPHLPAPHADRDRAIAHAIEVKLTALDAGPETGVGTGVEESADDGQGHREGTAVGFS